MAGGGLFTPLATLCYVDWNAVAWYVACPASALVNELAPGSSVSFVQSLANGRMPLSLD